MTKTLFSCFWDTCQPETKELVLSMDKNLKGEEIKGGKAVKLISQPEIHEFWLRQDCWKRKLCIMQGE